MIPKIDKPDEARYLYDLVARNDNTYDDPPNIPHQSNIINAVANAKFCSKIDLSDGYHNLRIIREHEKHTAFRYPLGYTELESYSKVTRMYLRRFRML